MQERGDQQTSKRVIYIFAVAFKVGIDFLFGKMERLSPTNMPTLQQRHFGVLTIVLFFKRTVTQA